jgi:HSP20 family protein
MIPWSKRGTGAVTRREGHPLTRLHDEFDALFNRFFGGMVPFEGFGETQPWWGLDVEDTGNEVVVRAEAPGFEKEDFDVEISNGLLTIKAERKQGDKEKEGGNGYSERRFLRTVTLPAGADPDKVEARYRNGILEVHLGKLPEPQARRIEVKG